MWANLSITGNREGNVANICEISVSRKYFFFLRNCNFCYVLLFMWHLARSMIIIFWLTLMSDPRPGLPDVPTGFTRTCPLFTGSRWPPGGFVKLLMNNVLALYIFSHDLTSFPYCPTQGRTGPPGNRLTVTCPWTGDARMGCTTRGMAN